MLSSLFCSCCLWIYMPILEIRAPSYTLQSSLKSVDSLPRSSCWRMSKQVCCDSMVPATTVYSSTKHILPDTGVLSIVLLLGLIIFPRTKRRCATWMRLLVLKSVWDSAEIDHWWWCGCIRLRGKVAFSRKPRQGFQVTPYMRNESDGSKVAEIVVIWPWSPSDCHVQIVEHEGMGMISDSYR